MEETRHYKIQSFAFVLSVCATFCVCLVLFCGTFNSNQKSKIHLENRVNPNDAPVESLIRLPGIGVSRARAIVKYREGIFCISGVNQVFLNCNDLQKVKGIGPKTVQNLNGLLKFK